MSKFSFCSLLNIKQLLKQVVCQLSEESKTETCAGQGKFEGCLSEGQDGFQFFFQALKLGAQIFSAQKIPVMC